MDNPYLSLPDYQFWRRSISSLTPEEIDPVVHSSLRINRQDKVATVGSCFAQHISSTLVREGFNYLVTERTPLTSGAVDEGYGVFPARFANIYTVRQFLQLFERAYGLFSPADVAWERSDGAFVDPFRPRIQEAGFSSPEALIDDRRAHLASVRQMFEQCDILVFTLGLTESWVCKTDGAVVPLAPGVVAPGHDGHEYEFHNCTVMEMLADFDRAVSFIRDVNPGVKIIITVSPVPLIATYEDRHVLVSTTYSKSALRVVAESVTNSFDNVFYFPSYEVITGSYSGARYFESDLREVKLEGVSRVMGLFKKHYLSSVDDRSTAEDLVTRRVRLPESPEHGHGEGRALRSAGEFDALRSIICDEEAIDQS
ncbi:GSCFA domain-containing protein [Brevundimonas sp.]|jgi:hypothetical protein|uniref:GSCFA domain-containing protein n=1 Tax=Brevundimonas sp. TaxID=1871086 RepID=UPI0037C0B902